MTSKVPGDNFEQLLSVATGEEAEAVELLLPKGALLAEETGMAVVVQANPLLVPIKVGYCHRDNSPPLELVHLVFHVNRTVGNRLIVNGANRGRHHSPRFLAKERKKEKESKKERRKKNGEKKGKWKGERDRTTNQ